MACGSIAAASFGAHFGQVPLCSRRHPDTPTGILGMTVSEATYGGQAASGPPIVELIALAPNHGRHRRSDGRGTDRRGTDLVPTAGSHSASTSARS